MRIFPANQCDIEPIHLINELQDFGLLIILSCETKNIIAIGENCNDYLSVVPTDALKKPIDYFFPELMSHFIEIEKKIARVKNNVLSVSIRRNELNYFINVRKVDNFFLLEIETEEESLSVNISQELNNYMSSIVAEKDLDRIFNYSVDTIQKLDHFDRVVLYRFKEDFSGVVVAESKMKEIDSLLGFHFPPSDIPLPARKMFENNPIRVVNRRSDRVVQIIRTDEFKDYNFNLGGAGLRAPHSHHIEYLSNMGIETSISISLVCEGRLWGLFICHNLKRRVPSPSIKNYLTLYANIVSIQIDLLIRNQIVVSSLEIESNLLRLIGKINHRPLGEIEEIFEEEAEFLSSAMNADGFVLQWRGKIKIFGEILPNPILEEILTYLNKNFSQVLFFTDHLGSFEGFKGEPFSAVPGILSVPISFYSGDRLLWFKKEMTRTIHWGGNPDDTITTGPNEISPRKSFAKFIETVKGKSEPWSMPKISALESFLGVRDIIEKKLIREDLALSLKRVKSSEEELRNLNHTKDLFFSIISHNLRSPFSGLIGLSDLLVEALGNKTEIEDSEILEYARDINISANKAFQLLKNLFEWGKLQTGKINVEKNEFELSTIMDEFSYSLIPNFKEKDLYLKVSYEENINLFSDYKGLISILTHILSNAKKYSYRTKPVTFRAYRQESLCKFEIMDQGIGMSEDDLAKLFKIESKFLTPGTEGETGTGLGLIIAKEYLRLLGGEIFVQSQLGKGTTVKVQIPLS